MRIKRYLLFGVLFVGSCAAAQIRGCMPEPHTLPEDLRSTLEARLAAFVSAQAQGRWDDVEELLGSKDVVYKSSYKRCLVSRMQEVRLVSFDLSTPSLYTCTTMDLSGEAVDRVTAERLSWYVRGVAGFQTSAETWSEETQMRAYRSQGQWYFIPPQRAMQEKWEKVHYTEADFARDRRDEIEVPNPPSAPMEITDVHVHMDRRFPSIRKIKFALRNRTSKKIVQLGVKIGSKEEQGSIEMEGPYEVKPKGYITLELDASAYADFCQGVSKGVLVVDHVHFADGSKWEFQQSTGAEKPTEKRVLVENP